jgi:transmembrane sensor
MKIQSKLERNPEAEFERSRVWELAGHLGDDPEIRALIARTTREIVARASRRRQFRPTHFLLAAASCAAIAFGLWVMVRPAEIQAYATAIGEQRSVVLADDSQVTMNTDTRIGIDFARTRRAVKLERGEAVFHVSADPTRPFEVVTGTGSARALGTVFSVANLEGRVLVSVLEGRVQVNAEAGTGSRPVDVELIAGQATRFGKGEGTPGAVYPADLARIAAWQAQQVEFQNVTLADAVAEYNRYTTAPLRLADPSVAAIRISGRFRIGEPETFVSALQRAYGLEVTRSGGEIALSAGPAARSLPD